MNERIVMKFGGASMAKVSLFAPLAALIEERLKTFAQIVVVVSAMGETTDELLELAYVVHPNPPKREQDMLITAGERVSIALLAMALDYRGIKAISFTGSQSGIITTSEHSQAKIIEVRPYRIEKALEEKKVAIVAGFQGMSVDKEITTLGRGGSDTSAVALAVALNAKRVEFYKDVPGIGEDNPKTHPDTPIFSHLTYDGALDIIGKGAEVLHHNALLLAKEKGIELQIRPFQSPETVGTVIAHEHCQVGSQAEQTQALCGMSKE